MRLTNIEKETVINFNEAERTASVYTHNEALKHQLLELCQSHPEQVRQTAANVWGGLTFELPKKWLKVSPPRILSAKCTFDSEKSFVDDTAEKLGVDPSTIRRQIQTAKNLTSEAKDIIRDTGTKITKKDALKLSRLGPEQQKDAASQLAAGEIKSMGEYHPAPAEPEEPPPPEPESPPAAPTVPSVPYSLGDKHYASIEESIADLKNPNKDCSYNPDTLLADIDGFVDTFHKNFAWYSDPFCTVVFPDISPVQFDFVRQRFATISSAMEDLLNLMERNMNK